jgi:23S rRNA (pseudouridine1915-N3)-methyltransferase
MKITLLLTGNTRESYIQLGVDDFRKRIERYMKFEIKTITGSKKKKVLQEEDIKREEAKKILPLCQQNIYTILLDEQGKEFNSVDFATFLNHCFTHQSRDIVFIIGGAYGVTKEVRQNVDHIISLSRMTFSHQLVRLVFTEQLYRALTIIHGEPYHHQ